MGVAKGRLRLKGLFAFGSAALALGYVVPTVGVASGPVTPVAAIAPVPALADPALASPALASPAQLPRRPAFLAPTLRQRTEVDAIPFTVRQVLDGSLLAGSRVIDAGGVAGLRTVVFQDALEEDQVVESTPVSEIDVSAVERVERIGTRVVPQPLPADPGVAYQQAIAGSATSYCLTGTTATGTQAGPGSIAVDPSVIRLGSHLYVPGYGFGWAVDTGGVIHGTLVDLWLTCDAAIQWGRRAVTIYVLTS